MHQFMDENGKKVKMAFEQGAFQQESYHVLVLCRYNGEWLLTRHKKRGLEFPGGKREKGETTEDAAIRETFEETGGVIHAPQFIGEYKVYGEEPFVKTIFFATVTELVEKDDYMETDGAVLWKGSFSEIVDDPAFSFIMKDQVVERSIKRVADLGIMT
ncbi:RNA deprotection pyrophosphohydrolase [Bacillus sp. KH172YL63]|uniref:RNA deprotection pyrophosphohydrolase n=1 Tax=Bacillus sp. KH172YL63 TaxID=2709784 RepID=UPI001566640B|nr:nucleoside triphosphatase YtkD [Bacillus sp. KH172YL63]